MRILVFSPYSAILPWRQSELALAAYLRKVGHAVSVVGCSGYQNHCIAMLARGLMWDAADQEREAVCETCRDHADQTSVGFGFDTVSLERWVKPEDHAAADRAAVRVNDFGTTYDSDGISLSNLCRYQVVIAFQLQSLDENNPAVLEAYRSEIRSAVLTLAAGKRMLSELRPEAIIMSNGLYPTGNILGQLAEDRGIRRYFLTNGYNRARFDDRFVVAEGHFYRQVAHQRDVWRRVFRSMPCTETMIRDVGSHITTILRGQTYYTYSTTKGSSNVEPIQTWRHGRKLALAVTSSWDELIAAQLTSTTKSDISANPFRDQKEWISSLLAFFSENPEWCLLIRPHPREYANRKSNNPNDSQHGIAIRTLLSGTLPANVWVNWPEQQISLYDLLDHADVVLNGWSSAGEEAGLLGIPSVCTFPAFVNYPHDLDFFAHSSAEYFSLVRTAILSGWDFERMRRFCRWRTTYSFRSEIDFPPEVSQYPNPAASRGLKKFLPFVGKSDTVQALARKINRAKADLADVEQMIRTGLPSLADLPSRITECGSIEEETAALIALAHQLSGVIGGHDQASQSPLAQNLANAARLAS
jgi:hypothetical protein